MGTWMRVPRGEPLSSISTRLLLSNLGCFGFCFCFRPTRMPFFIWPLMATSTLSPMKPTPRLLYTWMQRGGRPSAIARLPRSLLSTTRRRASFRISQHAGVVWISCCCCWGICCFSSSWPRLFRFLSAILRCDLSALTATLIHLIRNTTNYTILGSRGGQRKRWSYR